MAQLIDAITGRHVWSERYDREVKDIFALQDEITINVMNGMSIELTEGKQYRLWMKIGTDNLKALEMYYQGLASFYHYTKEDNDTARQLLEETIALDPKFAAACSLLGWTYFYDVRFGWSESPVTCLKKAFELAQKALAIQEFFDGAHSLLRAIYLVMRQYDKAVSEAERAVALNPNGSLAYSTLAAVIGCSGKWDVSILYEKRSMRLNPFPEPSNYWVLGRAYFMTTQYDESIAMWRKALQISPNFLVAHAFLAACYSSIGRDAEAAAESREVLRINPQFTIESYAKTLPYKNAADVEREVAALRKAGLN
jgi:adenylate cyclase